MRNPWVHDDVTGATDSGYGGRVRLLAAVVWGTLLLAVGGAALLTGTGAVDLSLAASLRTAVTAVVAGAMAVLLLPVVLKLLAVSRLLATVATLAGGWLVGGFVWSRESERIARYLPGDDGLAAGAESADGLVELVDALFSLL
jgi:hypothetical protein